MLTDNSKIQSIASLLKSKNFDRDIIEIVTRQLNMFLNGVKIPFLVKPCTIDDGIIRLDENQHKDLIEIYNNAALEGRLMKFVPASGAASRMFQKLQSVLNKYENDCLDDLKKKSETNTECKAAVEFISNLDKFAFYEELKSILNCNDEEMKKISSQSPSLILNTLLNKSGLGYSSKPKGAIKFHNYSDGARTAFEEQIYESMHYIPDRHNKLRIHFTISEEHTDLFNEIIGELKEKLNDTDFKFEISFSYQKKSTDTIAVDLENNPLFEKDGSLLMRPAGHGALLENLNDLQTDIVIIKNIDNLCVEQLAGDTFLFKKLLVGYLIDVQDRIFKILSELDEKESDDDLFSEAFDLIKNVLQLQPDENYFQWDSIGKKEYLKELLDRPIRVCGMVKNEGEPGGGPFWIRDGNKLSKQIVEQAQINSEDENQIKIFRSSTHFNPVDIICGLKNYKGINFDLLKFRDDESGIITIKSKDGRELKALELPGLWNGGMAHWLTIFIEVPISTFNPVKEINDLLRKEHQQIDLN